VSDPNDIYGVCCFPLASSDLVIHTNADHFIDIYSYISHYRIEYFILLGHFNNLNEMRKVPTHDLMDKLQIFELVLRDYALSRYSTYSLKFVVVHGGHLLDLGEANGLYILNGI